MSAGEAGSQKFNWQHFFIKLTSRAFLVEIAWIAAAFIAIILNGKTGAEYVKYVVIIAGAVTVLNILGDKVIDAIATAIRNTKINVEKKV